MTEELYVRFAALLAAALLVPSVTLSLLGITHRAINFWRIAGAGLFCFFVASTLSALRDIVTGAPAVGLSNLLVGLGYFLCLKSVRQSMCFKKYKHIETATLAMYALGIIIIIIYFNNYQNRVFFVSFGICVFSMLVAAYTLTAEKVESLIGWIFLMVFSIINSSVALFRMLAAAAQSEVKFLNLSLWDPIFFIWSIAGVFLFSIGQFINGNAILQKIDRHTIEITDALFERERKLSAQLSQSLEDQRNLQKLLLHEFKRPITSINAILQSGTKKSGLIEKHKVERIKTLSSQSVQFLEGFSQYEDIVSLFENPNFEEVSVKLVVCDIRSKWRIGVIYDNDYDNFVIRADRLLLDIALGNLIENAQKFGNNPRKIRVFINRDKDLLNFDIQDDGAGIPAAEWSKVWGKFHKSNNSFASVLHGCGLGLYVVSKIAHAHNGAANVVSQSPSTIRLQIPLKLKEHTNG